MIGQHYYTWCTKEAGCDGITGFQTRAKSPSINGEMENVIRAYCTQLTLPRSLEHILNRASDLTRDEVESTPAAVHFYPLGRDLFGLTRVRIHPRQTGRPGNLFAHTLVLPEEALREAENNPFSILRSGVFRNSEDGAAKQIEDLPKVPALAPSPLSQLLEAAPAGAVESMVRALAVSGTERRPLILATARPEQAVAAMEAALLLLPSGFRPHIAFSTNVRDPYEARPPQVDVLMLSVYTPEEGGRFGFQDHEYDSRYYVMNAVASRFSAAEPASPKYMELVSTVLKTGDPGAMRCLGEAHGAIDALSLDAPYLWDTALRLIEGGWKARLRGLASASAPAKTVVRDIYGQLGGERGLSKSVSVGLAVAAFALGVAGGLGVRSALERPALQNTPPPNTVAVASTASRSLALERVRSALEGDQIETELARDEVVVKFTSGLFSEGIALSPSGTSGLDTLAKRLGRIKDEVVIEIEGHTDTRLPKRGTPDNYNWGFDRARQVGEYLTERAPWLRDHVKYSSVGADVPLYGGDLAKNRTVVLHVRPHAGQGG